MKKVLLISYYFDPFKGVGAKRMGYWANAFFEDREPIFECTVVTATPQPEGRDNVLYVEDERGLWVDRFIQGISWVPNLKRFLNSSVVNYDYVIISGGPFGHFWITRYLKKRFSCRTILDYRDPFSENSRFNSHFVKEYAKLLFEKTFLRHVDHVITVNQFCGRLISKNLSSEKITIIENGYDEKIINQITTDKYDDSMIHVVYAGSFYEDRDPTTFMQAFLKFNEDREKFVFHHIGNPSDFLTPYAKEKNVHEHGQQDYRQTLEIIKKCHVGLIITGGLPMESTTKIYDYIGCNLDILVVTSGTPRTGSINDITSQVDEKAYWLKNKEENILDFLDSYNNRNKMISEKSKFSRFHGYEQLKELLQSV